MKKNLLLIRFGVPYPLPKEVKLAETILHPEDFPLTSGCPIPGGCASVFRTHLSPAELVAHWSRLAEETGDQLPVLAFDIDSPESAMDVRAIGSIQAMLDDFRQVLAKSAAPTRVELSLDQLLDLVHQRGVEGLSREEHELLKKLSENC